MSPRTTGLLGSMARNLTPKPKDSRKFRPGKPLVFSVEEARKVALAFHMTKEVSKRDDLTFGQFIVAMAENGFRLAKMNDAQVEVSEAAMKEILAVIGGARPVVVEE